MKILHIASFTGNVGDNASHLGLYKILNLLLPSHTVEQVEIRKFYRSYNRGDKKYFDNEFISLMNCFDLVLIGGGGFLDYWVEGSDSGTTIDINPSQINMIKVPTLITSVGCIPHKEVPSGNVDKFRKFLDAVIDSPNIRIAIRNDGSVNSFINEIGYDYLSSIPEILDNGFFFELPLEEEFFNQPYVAVNITSDQIQMQNAQIGKIKTEEYYEQLARSIHYMIEHHKLHIVFVPHIYSDFEAISKLLKFINDFYVRTKISIAPCIQGVDGARKIFSIYKYSEMVLGTRFHANVCSLAMGVPCIGLAALDRVVYLYEYMGLRDSYVKLDGAFSNELCFKIDTLINQSQKKQEMAIKLQDLKKKTLDSYQSMFRALRVSNKEK